MLKRWTGIRWLAGGIAVAVLVLVLAITWALFVPAADWLARHDVGSAKASGYATAVDNARGRLLTLGAGLFAAAALVFTARNFALSREGQVTDRYTKAIKQLGSKKRDVRIGGIYALERIARDSAMDHPTVMEVLTAFVRDHSRESLPPSPVDDEPGADAPQRGTRPDVQAAVTVIGRRNARHDRQQWLSLAHANLAGANLADANLADANLNSALLTGADLASVDLTGAYLLRANLADANLAGAWLVGAWLADAELTGAFLGAADLTSAYLGGARWPGDAPVPGGWQRDAGSGRLKSATGEPKSHAVPPGAGERAIVLLSNWAEGRYEDVAANFNATLTAKLPTEQLATFWTQTVATSGTCQRMGEPFVRQLDDRTVVDVPMEFEAGVRRGSVFFNADGQVSGLFIANPGTGER